MGQKLKEKQTLTIDEKKLVLESYIILIDRVEELRTEVADLRDRADSLLSNIDGMPRSQAEASKVERALERIEKSISKLITEEDAACATINNVITAIGQLRDVRERQILSLKYIGEKKGSRYRRYKLWEIANRMGYSVDRIKQLHRQALRHIAL